VSLSWKNQKERGTPFMLYLIRWIAIHLGRRTSRLILYPITFYFLLFAPSARRASYDYLCRVLNYPVRPWHVARHFFHFSATILDRVFLLTGRFSLLDIRIHNLDLVERQLAEGSGCILLGSHIGSFEALRALGISKYKLPVKVVMQEEHNETITRLLHSLNPEVGKSIIKLGKPDSLLKVHEYLQQGYLVGILGDRAVEADQTILCEVLGEKAELPTGPILAASVLSVPVILFFGIYNGTNRYDIYFEAFAEKIIIEREQHDCDMTRWLQKYADRLTFHARQSPYNWFNFYEFWDADV